MYRISLHNSRAQRTLLVASSVASIEIRAARHSIILHLETPVSRFDALLHSALPNEFVRRAHKFLLLVSLDNGHTADCHRLPGVPTRSSMHAILNAEGCENLVALYFLMSERSFATYSRNATVEQY